MTFGSGDAEHLAAFQRVFRPIANQFQPQFVLISAGFDGHRDDVLSNMMMTERGYAGMASILLEIAYLHADGRCVAVLEGGYNLEALATSVEAVVKTMCAGEEGAGDPEAAMVINKQELDVISSCLGVHSEYWDV
jgi:acetoin utilization deacetylase AcuC-like enzyme